MMVSIVNKKKKDDIHSRMAAAWEGLWDEMGQKAGFSGGENARNMIKYANEIRQERGDKKINIKGIDLEDDD